MSLPDAFTTGWDHAALGVAWLLGVLTLLATGFLGAWLLTWALEPALRRVHLRWVSWRTHRAQQRSGRTTPRRLRDAVQHAPGCDATERRFCTQPGCDCPCHWA